MSQLPRWIQGRPTIPVASLGGGAPLTEWLVTGPFRLDIPGGFYREQEIGRLDAVETDFLGCERTIRPVEGMEHRNADLPEGACRWEWLSGSPAYDLHARYPQGESAVAYGATYLTAEEPVDLMFWAHGTLEYHWSTVQVMLDGVEMGRGDVPFSLRIGPGEHCLLLKIAGGASRRHAWQIDVRAGIVQPLGGDLGVGLIRLPGFWRGREDAPEAEVEAVLVNRGGEPLVAEHVVARLGAEAPNRATNATTLQPSQAQAVRLAAPLGTLTPGTKTTVTVAHGTQEVAAEVVIPELPPPGIIHVMEGFHCDPVWVSDQHHYNLVSMENVRQLLDACLADSNYRAFLHEIDYLKPFVDEYPDYRAALFGLIQRGQVSLGSSYNEPNENNCSGEAIIRNILYGYGFHRLFLGGNPGVYHAWDVFGHIPQLSQIAAKSGLIGVLWSKPILGFPPVFRHLALDGTSLPHIRSLYGWGTHSMDRLRSSTASLLEEKHSFGLRRHLVVDCADFASPSGWMVGHTPEMAASCPQIVMTGPEEFLHGLTDDGAHLRLTSRNPSQYHVGTTHSRSEMKIANRLGENVLIAAERWATFAALMGATYPDLPLDKAWRQLLFAEHHDALSGTPCDLSYLDLMAGYREALDLGSDVLRRSTSFLAEAVRTPEEGRAVVVFNSLNWVRSGVVRIPKPEDMREVEVRSASGEVLPSSVDGEEVTFIARDVPSVGYATVTLHPADASGAKAKRSPRRAECSLENEFWRIALDPARGGGIASLVDKATGRELIHGKIGVGNDLVALSERGVRGGSPWEFWTTGARLHASQDAASVSIERSVLGETAVITGRLRDICSYRRTLTLRPGQRTVEASATIDGYRRDDIMFVVTTPVALSSALPVVEDRFGSIVTKRNRRQFDYRTAGNMKFSDCAVFPVYNWIEAGWSARVDIGAQSSLNLGLMGLIHSHDSAVERAIEPLLTAFAHAGVACTPYYDDDDMPRRATLEEKYYEPGYEKTRLENTLPSRLDDLGMTNQWMAISVAGDNAYVADLLKRLPEAARRRLTEDQQRQGWAMVVAEDAEVPEGWNPVPVVVLTASSRKTLTAAITQIGEGLAADGRIRLPEGCDFRLEPGTVDDYGVAILTNGTGAGALEPDGTLTLMLTKSAPWADVHLPRHFVPEHRQMVFHYGFYPHDGNWRDSEVVRAGYEFDNPLTAAQPTGKGGPLPPSQSFLALDAPDAVITAIKPVGNPVASFRTGASDPRRGIIVRAYNANGRGSRGRVALNVPISEAFAASLMEEDRGKMSVREGAVEWTFGPYAIETLRLVPGEVQPVGSGDLGAAREAVQPVWCRYWKHNTGAHPMGYLPVGIYLTGDLPIENTGGSFPTVGRVRVTINNNLTDRTISGRAQLIASPHWALLPAEIPYTLGPREHATTEVTVAFARHVRTGLIKARMEHDGQVYQDVIEAGRKTQVKIGGGGAVRLNGMDILKEREPEWQVLRDERDILVRVRNPWWEPLDAELVLVSPVETWGEEAGAYGLIEVGPRNVGLTIPGRQTARVRFRVASEGKTPPEFWAWMKLMCNGKPDYRPVPGTRA